jgi:hypothetical protein
MQATKDNSRFGDKVKLVSPAGDIIATGTVSGSFNGLSVLWDKHGYRLPSYPPQGSQLVKVD